MEQDKRSQYRGAIRKQGCYRLRYFAVSSKSSNPLVRWSWGAEFGRQLDLHRTVHWVRSHAHIRLPSINFSTDRRLLHKYNMHHCHIFKQRNRIDDKLKKCHHLIFFSDPRSLQWVHGECRKNKDEKLLSTNLLLYWSTVWLFPGPVLWADFSSWSSHKINPMRALNKQVLSSLRNIRDCGTGSKADEVSEKIHNAICPDVFEDPTVRWTGRANAFFEWRYLVNRQAEESHR